MKTQNASQSLPIDRRKAAAQYRALQNALNEMLYLCFVEKKVLDKSMRGFFGANRQLGSRDRKFISEAVFGCFRYWGILRRLLAGAPDAYPERERHLSAEETELIAGNTLVLCRIAHPMRPGTELPSTGDWFERAGALLRLNHAVEPASRAELLDPQIEPLLADGIRFETLPDLLNSRPPMWLRVQCDDVAGVIRALTAAGVEIRPHALLKEALAAPEPRVNLYTLAAFRDGKFEIQDIASQVIARVAAPQSGERWFDCCAGAGGKTLALAWLMQRKGTVVAGDIRAYKLEELKKRARRAQFPNITTREWDGKKLKERFLGKYDGILVDAPCSCSGVWRRNPEGRWQFSMDSLREFPPLQLEILENVAGGVKKGGVLIYATCSMFRMENQDVIRDFLARHEEFALESFVHPLTGGAVAGMLQIPMELGGDAMFVARMRRVGGRELPPDAN